MKRTQKLDTFGVHIKKSPLFYIIVQGKGRVIFLRSVL